MTHRMIALMLPFLLIGGATLSGCGVELVGGADHGEAETVITDEEPDQSAATLRSPAGRASFARIPQLSMAASGNVEADVTVALVGASGEVIPITPSSVRAEVGIASGDSIRVGLVELLPERFPRVRVTFSRVQAEVTTGLEIGGGVSLLGEVAVDLGQGPLVVEVPLEVEIRERERTTIVIDLNAGSWLLHADPIGRLVPVSAFRSAVTIEVK